MWLYCASLSGKTQIQRRNALWSTEYQSQSAKESQFSHVISESLNDPIFMLVSNAIYLRQTDYLSSTLHYDFHMHVAAAFLSDH